MLFIDAHLQRSMTTGLLLTAITLLSEPYLFVELCSIRFVLQESVDVILYIKSVNW